ncbi:DUF2339 domain-containing protein [Rhizobium sp. KVB221]|uniref:DUF2339 domain-containing protein n=1 Tax=Rhizobium setariae TaxID=2801340 RepID=A0A936YI36_9HYPH|nr:DUF2339 domain-containing protein [Rhizobium setariae]MBL0370570.1 DUF2339 domain-containing protein [Rhizobium setariae]
MFELISLIAIALAIGALSSARGTRARFDTELAALKLELKRLEGQVGTGTGSPQPSDIGEVLATGQGTAETIGEAATEAVPEEVGADAPEQQTAELVVVEEEPQEALAQTVAAAPRESFESRLAARWSVWVGGIALAFAGIFAVKYSIEQGLLSPAVRLSLAGLFGLVLMAAGEWVRRRSTPLLENTFQNALIPGILTAAGTLTLMGAVFVAHSVYGYFGPATAFILLCLISLATLLLSLIHGQALAGLGLVASFVTPLLVASEAPNPWPLFGFLSVAWIGSSLASKLCHWRVAPAIGNAGLSAWAVAYLASVDPFHVAPVALSLLIMLAGIAFIWPGRWSEPPSVAAPELALEESADGETDGEVAPTAVTTPQKHRGAWEQLVLPRHIASTLTAALGVMAAAIAFVAPESISTGYAPWGFAILVIGLALLGAIRTYAFYPAAFAALTALGGIRVMSFGAATVSLNDQVPDGFVGYTDPAVVTWLALGLGLFQAGLGVVLAFGRKEKESPHAIAWSVISIATPLVLASVGFFYFGNYFFDLKYGLYAVVLGVLWLASAEGAFRGAAFAGRYVVARDLFVAGSWAAFVFALIVMTDGITTTIGSAVLGFVFLNARRIRDWPVLPWAMAASAIFVAGRIAWEPTIVGASHLGTTPVFNALLAGYGIPSALLIASAWIVRKSDDVRLRNVMEALASLFTLLTLGILVRHAMNGGQLNSAVPTLAEQAIYTLLTVGASATLMNLDLRRPSIVFRTGSMAVGYLSMVSVIAAHYVGLNPYLTGELTGRIPFFNLLFLAYLLPGLAYGLAAWYARDRRPLHYVIALALTGASLLFAYVTLSVRRIFHGEGIADWKGFQQAELYTYSVVWLLLGVLLLVVGYRFRAKSIRIASAVLVLIAVVKVFLIDMSNLEGLYRVLSFIGLGVALIGIGRFYQTILTGLAGDEPHKDITATPTEGA